MLNIASTTPDKNDHMRGDTPSSVGDSGGGCFSLETGMLIAVCVGREVITSTDARGAAVTTVGQQSMLVHPASVFEAAWAAGLR